jgi:lipopolysaccharide/colanic/teichoic acid biosynthesis glycosyltransferase
MMIRFYDILLSIVILLFSLPILIIIAIAITIESRGGIIFKQTRVGQHDKDFVLFKFRTMYTGSHLKASLTIGEKDPRITKTGYFLRKYKLDELPQFFNVLRNDMSIVGPRPEVRKYVDLYDEKQKKVLALKPGITDYASIKYKNENLLLAKHDNPEEFYIKIIIPDKFRLNMETLTLNPKEYFSIIFKTFFNTVFKS